jgi:hypothetical protein
MICDDVRREDNGKEIIIGVYTGAVLIESVPSILPVFCVRFIIRVPMRTDVILDGSINGPDGHEIVKLRGNIKIDRPDPRASFSFRIAPLIFTTFGGHEIKAGIGAKPRTVYKFNVMTREQFNSSSV